MIFIVKKGGVCMKKIKKTARMICGLVWNSFVLVVELILHFSVKNYRKFYIDEYINLYIR